MARTVKFTSKLGMEVEFKNNSGWLISCDAGYALTPGIHQLEGQIGWQPDFDSVIKVYMENGTIVRIKGGTEAREWEAFLYGFEDPQMFRVSYVCYGFHLDAKLSGFLGEDERVWGCTEWGFGSVGSCPAFPDGIPAKSHTDGVSLNISIWLDGMKL